MITGLPLAVAAAVLGSAVLHATWNALAKAIPHRLLATALMAVGELVIAGVWWAVAPRPDPASWPYLGASAVLQTGYLLLLTAAYSHGEFRRVYPVARGTAPLLVTVFSLLVLGESLHPGQLVGIALLIAALAVLALAPAARRVRPPASGGVSPAGLAGPDQRHRAGLGLALATGVVIAAYSLVDGLGVRHSGSAAGYAAWLMTMHGALTLLTSVVLAGPRQLTRWARGDRTASGALAGPGELTAPGERIAPGDQSPPGGRRAAVTRLRDRPAMRVASGIVCGVLSLAAYAIVVWAQSRASLSLVSALRETSVLFAGAIGALFFAERFSARQSMAAIAVVGGIALIQLA